MRNFHKIWPAILVSVLLSLVPAAVHADVEDSALSAADLFTCGDKNYTKLASWWGGPNAVCFWCLGTHLHTLIDYIDVRGENFCDPPRGSGVTPSTVKKVDVEEFGCNVSDTLYCPSHLDSYEELAEHAYITLQPGKDLPLYSYWVRHDSCWYDDIGWWAVASARLYERLCPTAEDCDCAAQGLGNECQKRQTLAMSARKAAQALWQYTSHGGTRPRSESDKSVTWEKLAEGSKTYKNLEAKLKTDGTTPPAGKAGSFEPVFSGGAWNTCYGKTGAGVPGPSPKACRYTAPNLYVNDSCQNNPATPGPPTAHWAAIQNSVTNGLWLQSSSMLYRLAVDHGWEKQPDPDDPSLATMDTFDKEQYLRAAQNHMEWLIKWSEYRGQDDAKARVNPHDSPFFLEFCGTKPCEAKDEKGGKSGFLVKERVSQYKNGAPVYGYSPQRAWTGGQGLFMAGLSEFHAATRDYHWTDPTFQQLVLKTRKYARETALTIAETTREVVVADCSGDESPSCYDGVVLAGYNWYGGGKSRKDGLEQGFGFDPGDYRLGPAVYMRHLQGMIETGAIPRDGTEWSKWSDYIKTNAGATCEQGGTLKTPHPKQFQNTCDRLWANLQSLINVGICEANPYGDCGQSSSR